MKGGTDQTLALLVRVLSPSDKLQLAREVFAVGAAKATQKYLRKFTKNFPSVYGQPLSSKIPVSLMSMDYFMPNGAVATVNIFQDGEFMHINCDKLKPITDWVLRRMCEDGMVLSRLDRKKTEYFPKRYYRVYQILNTEETRIPLCYS